MCTEDRFLVTTAAYLVALTSRLQTASIEADCLFFLGVFVAVLAGEDIESQTVTETVTETVMFFIISHVLLPHVLPFSRLFTGSCTKVFSLDEEIQVSEKTDV